MLLSSTLDRDTRRLLTAACCLVAYVMGRDFVSIGSPVWLNVDDRLDGIGEPMVQSMLDLVGSFVSLIHGQIGVNGDRHRHAQLVTLPTNAQIRNIFDLIDTTDGFIDFVADRWLDTIKQTS